MANEFLKNLGTNLQELSGGPLVPANLDPANQGVGNYTQYGFQSGEEGVMQRGVQPLRYTGIGSQSLVNLNKTTYTAALNAASDQETTQLKKLYKKLTA
jgi:hypothetical protein|tara:strand:+ start:231 stop:527 length:297 start_codon:yes stop_codon:yes gene_type:complete